MRADLAKLDKGDDISKLSSCVTVLDACYWLNEIEQMFDDKLSLNVF